MNSSVSRMLTFCSAILLPASAWAQFQFDQVVIRKGAPLSGKVLEFDNVEITVDVRGTTQKVPVNEVRRVTYEQDTQELRRGRDQAVAGQYAAALAELQRVDIDSITRPEVKQDAQYYRAFAQGRLALTGGGDKNAAAAAMLEFVRTAPNSYHFFEAAELLGDLAVSLGSLENAVKYYSAIGSKAPWPEYKMRAAILEARAQVAQENYAAAQQKYEEVMGFTVDTPEANSQKLVAEVGKTLCMAETGGHGEAITILERIIQQNDPQDVQLFGRAYNALGRCYLKAGKEKEALLAYLHNDVLFYADADVHAEALYNLTKLWTAAGKSDRAVGARNLLTDRYSGSKWAKMQ